LDVVVGLAWSSHALAGLSCEIFLVNQSLLIEL
jgi:hypothetical protein